MAQIGFFPWVRAACFAAIGWSLISSTAAQAADMSFSLRKVTLGFGILAMPIDVIVADGDISAGTGPSFDLFLGTNRIQSGTLMTLNSGGGDLDAGLTLGQAIRHAGLNTEVGTPAVSNIGPATCASACTFMFLGGVTRTVAPGSQFGVHRFARGNQPDDLQYAQLESAKLIAFVREMGVSTSLIERMAEQGPENITWLTPQDMASLGVTSSRHTDYHYVGSGGTANLVVTTSEGASVPGQMAFSCSQHDVVARVAFIGGAKITDWTKLALSWSTENNQFAITSAPAPQARFVRSDGTDYAFIDSYIPDNVLSAAIAGGAWIGAYASGAIGGTNFNDTIDLDDSGRAQLGLIARACNAT